uniref:Si:ch211-262i1.5 n=1 Tax=Astyanax mexicanus TaxID=7994 RepID=A0A8B9KJZ6_ASTMX
MKLRLIAGLVYKTVLVFEQHILIILYHLCKFVTYNHLMAFWELIEPATHQMIRVTSSKMTRETGMTRKPTQTLPTIDEFFMFMMHLALGLKQRDLAHRFHVHQSTVSRIITSWANFLFFLLGSVCIWVPKEKVQAHLPEEFGNFQDTQVILDCTELHCQTPSSLLLQSEVFSNYKSHCTFKALIGMEPHGAITFVSGLYAGSISDREMFRQSGITPLFTPDMAIMVDKGFLVDDLVPCKIHRPVFLKRSTQMSAHDVKHTQSLARLRVHVERCIRRVKEHKLFDTVIPMSISGSINQLFTVSCLLVNYQNGPLVKAWS